MENPLKKKTMKAVEILTDDCIVIKSVLIITDYKRESKSLLVKGLDCLRFKIFLKKTENI